MTLPEARAICKANAKLAVELYLMWKGLGLILTTTELAESVKLSKAAPVPPEWWDEEVICY